MRLVPNISISTLSVWSSAQIATFICLNPAFSRRCFAEWTAWKAIPDQPTIQYLNNHYMDLRVGEAFRNSTKSSARLRDAFEAMFQLCVLRRVIKIVVDIGVYVAFEEAPPGLIVLNRPANVLTALMKQGVVPRVGCRVTEARGTLPLLHAVPTSAAVPGLPRLKV